MAYELFASLYVAHVRLVVMVAAGQLSEYCNMETFRARCHHGDVVVMETALFGRMRVGRCITFDAYLTALQQLDPTSLGCSADVLAYMDQVCSGRASCDVSVPNPNLYVFRPCSGQLTMYMEASYSCVTGIYPTISCYRIFSIFIISAFILKLDA